MAAPTKPQSRQRQEEKHLMIFHDRNAGPEGFHDVGDQHEVGESKARALAFDRVASYADEGMQADFEEEHKQAMETNEKRAALGLKRLPVGHAALKPGSENAMARFGQPAGVDPRFVGMPWQQIQHIAESVRAATEAENQSIDSGPADSSPSGSSKPKGSAK